MKRKFIVFLLLFSFCLTGSIYAQVTIGSGLAPNKGALLDLKQDEVTNGAANATKGLLLPRLNLASLKIIDGSNDLKTTIENASAGEEWDSQTHTGLTVYHLAENNVACPGVFVWSGEMWEKLGTPCPLLSLKCGGLNISLAKGFPVEVYLSVAYEYTRNSGEEFTLIDGTKLGFAEGLTVQVNGNQTLSSTALNKVIKIKITGIAPDRVGSLTLPFFLPDPNSEVGCEIAVRLANTDLPLGKGELMGKVCFDINRSNYGGDCQSKLARDGSYTEFATIGPVEYTFTAEENGTNVRFMIVEWMDDKQAVGRLVESWLGDEKESIVKGEKVKLTVNYQKTLNDDDSPIFGRTRSNAAKVKLYATYNNGARDVMVQLNAGIMDCICCPGTLIIGGAYKRIGSGNLVIDGGYQSNGLTFDQLKPYFKAENKDLCIYEIDAPQLELFYSEAMTKCANGEAVDPKHSDMGWRVPNLMELGQLWEKFLTLKDDPNSSRDVENMSESRNNPLNTYPAYWSSDTYSTYGAVWENESWFWNYNDGQGTKPEGGAYQVNTITTNEVRCVKTFEPF